MGKRRNRFGSRVRKGSSRLAPDAAAAGATSSMAPRGGAAPCRISVRGRPPPPPARARHARTASPRATENAALGSAEQHTAAGRRSPAARVGTRSHSSARRAHATCDGGAATPVGPRCSAKNARHTVAGESDVHHTHTTTMR